ncbi:MAG: hypothetical protein WDO24_22995 [Pseudomonadota bacterium]
MIWVVVSKCGGLLTTRSHRSSDGNVAQIVRVVDRDAVRQAIVRDRATATVDGGRIDVGKTQAVAQPVGEHREADEAGTAAPFEYSPRPGQLAHDLQIGREQLGAAAVELRAGTTG